MVGEPASTFWGNRSAGPGGTARPGLVNAYLIKKVRTPSGKPGWGTKYIRFDGGAAAPPDPPYYVGLEASEIN